MRIGIIADIHDHISNLDKALQALKNVDAIMCCGDLCSPFIVKQLGEGFPKDIHVVFGNNDADLFRITKNAGQFSNIKLYGEYCELDLGGKKIAVNHFDNIGRSIARSNEYDLVCFGHNHQFEISRSGGTLIINPGEIMGELSGESTCAIYDSDTDEAEKIIL